MLSAVVEVGGSFGFVESTVVSLSGLIGRTFQIDIVFS